MSTTCHASIARCAQRFGDMAPEEMKPPLWRTLFDPINCRFFRALHRSQLLSAPEPDSGGSHTQRPLDPAEHMVLERLRGLRGILPVLHFQAGVPQIVAVAE